MCVESYDFRDREIPYIWPGTSLRDYLLYSFLCWLPKDAFPFEISSLTCLQDGRPQFLGSPRVRALAVSQTDLKDGRRSGCPDPELMVSDVSRALSREPTTVRGGTGEGRGSPSGAHCCSAVLLNRCQGGKHTAHCVWVATKTSVSCCPTGFRGPQACIAHSSQTRDLQPILFLIGVA